MDNFINNIEIQTYRDCLNSNKYSDDEKWDIKRKLAGAIENEKDYRKRNQKTTFVRKPIVISETKKITMCYWKFYDIEKDKEIIERLSADYVDSMRDK